MQNQHSHQNSELFSIMGLLAGVLNEYFSHATSGSGIPGMAVSHLTTIPISLAGEVGHGRSLTDAAVRVGAETGLSVCGYGMPVLATRTAQLLDRHVPNTTELNTAFNELPADLQESLGQPDLALYGILRGAVWCAARVGDGLDIGLDLIQGKTESFQPIVDCYNNIKNKLTTYIDQATGPSVSMSASDFHQLAREHINSVLAAQELNGAGGLTYLTSLDQVLSQGLVYFDQQYNKYIVPQGVQQYLRQHACNVEQLNRVSQIFSSEAIEGTAKNISDACTEYLNKKDIITQKDIIPQLQERLDSEAKRINDQLSGLSSVKGARLAQLTEFGTNLYQVGAMVNQISWGAIMLGGHQRTWQGIGLAGQGCMQVGQAMAGFQAAQAAMAAGAMMPMMCTGVGMAVGLISIGCALFANDGDDNGLGEALQAISQSIEQLRQEMRENFEITWEMLGYINDKLNNITTLIYHGEVNNQRRFNILYHTLVESFDYVYSSIKSMRENATAQAEHNHQELVDYLTYIGELRAVEVIRQLQYAHGEEGKRFIDKFVKHSTTLQQALITEARTKARSGKLSTLNGGLQETDSIIYDLLLTALSDEEISSGYIQRLGLLSSLSAAILPSLGDYSLINPKLWRNLLISYVDLNKRAKDKIFELPNYAEYLEEISAVKQESVKVTKFLESVQGSKELWNLLIERYITAVSELRNDFESKFEEQRKAMNRQVNLPEENKYLLLTESVDEAIARISQLSEDEREAIVKGYLERVVRVPYEHIQIMYGRLEVKNMLHDPIMLLGILYGNVVVRVEKEHLRKGPPGPGRLEDGGNGFDHENGLMVNWGRAINPDVGARCFGNAPTEVIHWSFNRHITKISISINTIQINQAFVDNNDSESRSYHNGGWYDEVNIDRTRIWTQPSLDQINQEARMSVDNFIIHSAQDPMKNIRREIEEILEFNRLQAVAIIKNHLNINSNYARYNRVRVELFVFIKLINPSIQFLTQKEIEKRLDAIKADGSIERVNNLFELLTEDLLIRDLTDSNGENLRRCLLHLTDENASRAIQNAVEPHAATGDPLGLAKSNKKAQIQFLLNDWISVDLKDNALYQEMTMATALIEDLKEELSLERLYNRKLTVVEEKLDQMLSAIDILTAHKNILDELIQNNILPSHDTLTLCQEKLTMLIKASENLREEVNGYKEKLGQIHSGSQRALTSGSRRMYVNFYQSAAAKENGSMNNRVVKQSQGYIRHKVLGDGNCGYTALGITREEAAKLLLNESLNIRDIIKIPVRQALVTKDFYQYLVDNSITNLGHDELVAEIEVNIDVINAYIHYDVALRRIDSGYSHPAVLQALAHIKNIELHIWQLGKNNVLVQHTVYDENYAVYTPPQVDSRVDLLFVNGNHFDRLELRGYENNMASEGIYPLDSSWGPNFYQSAAATGNEAQLAIAYNH